MLFRNWWHRIVGRKDQLPSRGRRPAGRRPALRRPLALEPLEQRTVPSFLPGVTLPNGDGLADLIAGNTFSNNVGALLNVADEAPAGARPAGRSESAEAQVRGISTLFTGEQDGVDLDVNFVLSSLGDQSPPPFDVDGGSIVNTDHAPFTLGQNVFAARFGGDGRAFHSGIPELYRFADGGRNFFGVRGKGVAVITFDQLPASVVTLSARGTHDGLVSPTDQDLDGDGIVDFVGFGPLGNASAVVRAFDLNGQLIAEHVLDNFAMTEIVFQGPVSRIELVNQGDANSFADIASLKAAPLLTNVPARNAAGLDHAVAVALANDEGSKERSSRTR